MIYQCAPSRQCIFKACGNEGGWKKSRLKAEMMDEEFKVDKWGETHLLTSGKKAEICN